MSLTDLNNTTNLTELTHIEHVPNNSRAHIFFLKNAWNINQNGRHTQGHGTSPNTFQGIEVI